MFARAASLLLLICVFANLSAAAQSQPEDVWTWHYDNYRTGWQQQETTLTTSNVKTDFGKIMQFNVAGAVYAQPLALQNVSGMTGCPAPPSTCNVVFVVTQQDMLYAFNADFTISQTPGYLWKLDLAGQNGGTYLNCSQMSPTPPDPPCEIGVITPDIGVTGTPVIDRSTNTLWVASLDYVG